MSNKENTTHLQIHIREAFEKFAPHISSPSDRGSFLIDMGLGMLGLSDQDKATVEAQVPTLNHAIGVINDNMDKINQAQALYTASGPAVTQLTADLNKAMPAILLISKALSKQTTSQSGTGPGNLDEE